MVGDKKLQRDGGGKVGRVSSISKVSMVESKAIGEEKKQSRIDKIMCAKQIERVKGTSRGHTDKQSKHKKIRVRRVSR